jgi:hypothetical protein
MKRILLLLSVLFIAQIFAFGQTTGNPVPNVNTVVTGPGQGGGGGGLAFVASLPATCTPGVTASVQLNVAPYAIYFCDATNHWTIASSGSGAAAFCINLYVSGGYPAGNFFGLCAPASLAASLQYTLPTADGTAAQSLVTDGSQHFKFLSFASGISNFNQTTQSQVVVSATEYYITRSDLDMPAVYTQAIAAGTTMTWRVALTKTAAGTGTFQILLKKGTIGAISDATLVTQTIGTQTAAADNMECDIQLTWTSATGAYWSIIPHQAAASGTGFGLVYPAAAAQFSGTIFAQTTTTASDKYGLSVIFTTGTPTFVVNYVKAQAFGVN